MLFLAFRAQRLLFTCLLLVTLPAFAQFARDESGIQPLDTSEQALNKRQQEEIQHIVKQNFGPIELKGDKTELRLLQKILDKGLIDKEDTFDLQALGVVLGNIIAKNLYLEWVSFEDQYGKSRALRYQQSEDVLFPITMISRRYQNDLDCDIQQLYDQAEDWVNKKRNKY